MLDLRRPKDLTDMTISEVDEWIDKDEPELIPELELGPGPEPE